MKTFKELKSELNAKYMAFKIKAKTKCRQAIYWVEEHPEETKVIAVLGVGIAGAAFKVGRDINRKIDLKKAQDLKDRYIYDRSLGYYHELKRKPRESELRVIDERRSAGESLVTILSSMNLLK